MTDLVPCPRLSQHRRSIKGVDLDATPDVCPVCDYAVPGGLLTGLGVMVAQAVAAKYLLEHPEVEVPLLLQDNTLERIFTDALFPALVPVVRKNRA